MPETFWPLFIFKGSELWLHRESNTKAILLFPDQSMISDLTATGFQTKNIEKDVKILVII